MYEMLLKAKHNGYTNILTGDESWFLYQYSVKGAWLTDEQEAPFFEKSNIQLKKNYAYSHMGSQWDESD